MKISKLIFIFNAIGFTLSGAASWAEDINSQVVQIGDSRVKGDSIKPFHGFWSQKTLPDGKQTGGYEEIFTKVESPRAWQHKQIVTNSNGAVITNVMLLDRDSLSPISLKQEIQHPKMPKPRVAEYTFSELSYLEKKDKKNGEKQTKTIHLPTQMFNTSNFGLVLAALPLEKGVTFRLPIMYPQFQAGLFWATVTVSGERDYDDGRGHKVPAWQVDIEWINIRVGDIYLGGEKSSGGSYFIVKEPHDFLPPVLAYVNDTSLIEVTVSN